ncbi:MAG: hypothetical protein WC736_15665 [Gallionella sp.]|jgi:hypothetical protein
MSAVYTIVGAGTLIGGYLQGQGQQNAAEAGANAQMGAATMGIEEQRRQFDAIMKLLQPYTAAGEGALGQQQALLGLSGPEAQQKAIDELQNSPQFLAMTQQGENAILQNASATGGLRGGNTQGALAQFRPRLLSEVIQNQFSNLGTITSTGANAAGGLANAGATNASQIAALMQQFGAAQAGGAMGAGQAQSTLGGAILGGTGMLAGMF